MKKTILTLLVCAFVLSAVQVYILSFDHGYPNPYPAIVMVLSFILIPLAIKVLTQYEEVDPRKTALVYLALLPGVLIVTASGSFLTSLQSLGFEASLFLTFSIFNFVYALTLKNISDSFNTKMSRQWPLIVANLVPMLLIVGILYLLVTLG